MAELPLNEAIPRFKSNEDRMDRFTNGGTDSTWLTSGGIQVPSLRKFLFDKNAEINNAVVTVFEARDQAVAARGQAVEAVGAAVGAKDLAQAWAESPSAPGGTGTKSAKSWAQFAEALFNGTSPAILLNPTVKKSDNAGTGGRILLEQGDGNTLPGANVAIDTYGNLLRFYASNPDGSDLRGIQFDLGKLTSGIRDFTGAIVVVNVRNFDAKGNGTANDTAAIQAAVNYIKTLGGGILFFPRGVYRTFATINVTGTSNVTFMGEGPNASIVELATADQWMFYDDGTTWWRTWRDLGFRSAVTMNAGTFFFNLVNDKRGLFDNCQMRGYAHGIWFQGFEETKLRDVRMSAPSTNGTAVIAGSNANYITGANLYIESCFFRGFDDITQDQATLRTGSVGLDIRDCNAVFASNSDWSAYGIHDVMVTAQWGAADHHFVQCFFDTTHSNHCFFAGGGGLKQKFTFTGSWFAGAANFGSGSFDASGFCAPGIGDFRDFVFTGCRFYSNKGCGAFIGCQSGDFQFTGCHFNRNGFAAPNFVGGLYIAPPGVDVYGPSIIANRFMQDNVGGDIIANANARGLMIVNNYCQNGIGIGGANHIIANNRTP